MQLWHSSSTALKLLLRRYGQLPHRSDAASAPAVMPLSPLLRHSRRNSIGGSLLRRGSAPSDPRRRRHWRTCKSASASEAVQRRRLRPTLTAVLVKTGPGVTHPAPEPQNLLFGTFCVHHSIHQTLWLLRISLQ